MIYLQMCEKKPPVQRMNFVNAELTKISVNTYVTTKISYANMLACQLIFGGTLYWTVLLLPLWFIPFLAFLLGITWLLSAMGAFTRDTAYLMMTIAPVLMFATPVFWSHAHEPVEHSHEHEHDEHHRHAHPEPVPAGVRHTHRHRHELLTHSHPHYPDSHHRHEH